MTQKSVCLKAQYQGKRIHIYTYPTRRPYKIAYMRNQKKHHIVQCEFTMIYI